MALISNSPVMNKKVFADASFSAGENTMTIEGTIIRALILLFCVIGAAMIPWHAFFSNISQAEMNAETLAVAMQATTGYIISGALVGLVLALIISFKPHLARVLAIPYALAEGLAIGSISAYFEFSYPGIVMQAAASTFAVFFIMLLLYYKRVIVPSRKFKAVIGGALLAVMLVYVINMLMSFWGSGLSMVSGNGVIGIAFSFIVCIVAALSLICDFEIIEEAAARRAPKYMAWYGAFAMMVTLIWLYMEILRLLSKLRSRN